MKSRSERLSRAALLIVAAQLSACTADAPDHIPPISNEEKEDTSTASYTPPPKASNAPTKPRATPAAMEPPNPKHLRIESSFIAGKGISTHHADEVLESSATFTKALDEMNNDASRSLEVQDITRHIRKALDQAVGADAAVAGFGCGLTICMGAVKVRSVAEHERWVMRFLNDSSFRTFGFVDNVERVGSAYESRFLLSTDPEVPGVTVTD